MCQLPNHSPSQFHTGSFKILDSTWLKEVGILQKDLQKFEISAYVAGVSIRKKDLIKCFGKTFTLAVCIHRFGNRGRMPPNLISC